MYLPPVFTETRLPILQQAIRACGLATVVTFRGQDGLCADHLPLVLCNGPEDGPLGTLLGHVSRANPLSCGLVGDCESLVIFGLGGGYISPSWYPSKAEHGMVVPTWNYITVHAYGWLETFEEPDRLREVVAHLTDIHEAGRDSPWRVADAPAAYIAKQLKGVVGLRLRIARLEGKWKMSQNRTTADRDGAIAGLRDSAVAGDCAPGSHNPRA
ncbi:transcriptional regulator [uncultured Gammaproteobacteria bacterium]